MGSFILFRFLAIILVVSLVLVATLIVIKYYFSLKKYPQGSSVEVETQKILFPLRLQAYERIILFLERISPNNLIMRMNLSEMNVLQLQSALIRTIKEEFEYNLSQQLYISFGAWELVKNAKEETIKLIHLSAGKLDQTAPSGELVRMILEMTLQQESLPVNQALDGVKREVQKLF
jgi:hypothetical protein